MVCRRPVHVINNLVAKESPTALLSEGSDGSSAIHARLRFIVIIILGLPRVTISFSV